MAMTVALPGTPIALGKDPRGPLFHDVVNITGDSSYPNPGGPVVGGEDIDALIKAQIGEGRTILNVMMIPSAAGGGPWVSSYDSASGKLKLWDYAGAEVADGVNVSTFSAVPHLVTSY